jgi:opacity protein-like surface antigen
MSQREARNFYFLRETMKSIWKFAFILLLFVPSARAQAPVFAGGGPVIEASAGYSYQHVATPSLDAIGMQGIDTSINADVTRRFGVKLDVGYSRAFNVYGTTHDSDMLTYMAGPLFYPVRHRSYDIYTELLLGGARQTGINLGANDVTFHGFVNKFAWAAGGGVQYKLTPSFSVRGGADFLHSSFFNDTANIQGQNTIRGVLSIVYTFGEGRE